MANKMIGAKYQTYVKDQLIVFRIVKIEKDGTYIVTNGKKRVRLTEEEINKMVLLAPDAYMNIFSCTFINGETIDDDIYVALHKMENPVDKVAPVLIIRQNVISETKNLITDMSNIYMGDCITYLSAGEQNTMANLIEFQEMKDFNSICIYVDDKLSDIEILLASIQHKFNLVLTGIKEKVEATYNESKTTVRPKGFSETVVDLLKDNNFMYNFRLVFGMLAVNFQIGTDSNTDKNGVVLPSNKVIERIENEILYKIANPIIIKYDKDIDMSKIAKTDHTVMSDSNDNIYLVRYVKVAPIIKPENTDVMEGMMRMLGKK